MLDEYKELYYQKANLLHNWENLSISELANLCLVYKDTDSSLYESFLSALVYKFWPITTFNYTQQVIKLASEFDCYNWTITAILYAIDKHVWTDPANSLYKDDKGPEKAINVCIKSEKLNYFTFIKKQKRTANYNSLSLDNLEENASDGYYVPFFDKHHFIDEYMSKKIVNYFSVKDYTPVYVLDAIINYDVFEVIEDEKEHVMKDRLSVKKLKHHLHGLDSTYCQVFSLMYSIEYEKVLNSIRYVTAIEGHHLERTLETLLRELSKDKNLMSYLGRSE